ncbi:amino acid/amide ABC transporter membrane protein 1, HAAT family [Rhizobiales bacterium GAS191]|nr:amino acid/amide ABC transporter membrane protein 1, HAAT family [Rhizobiales bacterium GAS113]SEC19302.1 amino acid/amide ABC transporter membrane protein 1, HAAT family [Rhizobiales bacterium GAS191]
MSEVAARAKPAPAVLSAALGRQAPILLCALLCLIGLVAIGTPSTWLTLTIAGLAMGTLIFIIASGLTIVFGLMDVINFGHGAFVTIGAYMGYTALTKLPGLSGADGTLANLAAILAAAFATMLATGLLGLAFERVILRPVYGSHLKQILVTTGGLIILQQLTIVVFGPVAIHLDRPPLLKGALVFGQTIVESYRIVAVIVGVALLVGLKLLLSRTKIGLLVRAGVEDKEMVEALGYRIKRLFVGVFALGSAFAGLGGLMWGLYQETVDVGLGSETLILAFIVVIIGGLGSIEGCFVGALLVGLVASYTAFLVPKLALVSNIALMLAILMWRPQGLYGAGKTR